MKPITRNFKNFQQISALLDELKLNEAIKHPKQILIKPNLVDKYGPPTTTTLELTEEIINYCQKHSHAKIIIAEGSGGCDTELVFEKLGYDKLAKKYSVELIDLNRTKRIIKENPHALKLKKVHLPEIAFDSYIINLPVLKIHSCAKLTAAMKNIYGFYLNTTFISDIGEVIFHKLGKSWWNKSELHFHGVDETIFDLNNYIKVDFNLVDGSIGQLKNEVNGIPCDPPIGKLIAGYNAKEVDIECAKLLDLDPKEIKYLNI